MAQHTRVVHLKREEYDVRIDRATRWGNPFPINSKHDRETVIRMYRDWLWQEIRAGRVSLQDLATLSGQRLGCWCAPRPCHGDVLVNAAEWAKEQLRKDET